MLPSFARFIPGRKSSFWPGLTVPASGTTLPGATVTFQWAENDVPVDDYRLVLGSIPGGSDHFDSGLLGTATMVTANGLPTDGSTVYARLEYRFADRWQNADVTYQTRNLPTPSSEPELLAPAPSSRLSSSSVPFEWTANDTDVRSWRLKVGSRPNGREYFFSRHLPGEQSVLVDGLPTDGSLLFTRLLYRTDAGWSFIDSVNMAALLPGSKTPTLDLPIPGSDLPSNSVLATWSANATPVTVWWVYAGSERGRHDYFNSGPLSVTSVPVTGLPAEGNAVYLRLWYREGLRWHYRDFAFGDVDLGSGATSATKWG